jgi:2-phospho-L-lactate/phosphoenolpyruvate guanylyltransferase
MPVTAIIPFKPENPKTRLASVMNREERAHFACAMLTDVVAALRGAGCTPLILSTHPFSFPGVEVQVSRSGLNESINGILPIYSGPVCIVMADLPLADPESLERLVTASADVSIVPGRGGGSNCIFIREGHRFRVNYYGASFQKHWNYCREHGLHVTVTDSMRLHIDIDEPYDLVEVLLHGSGESRRFLEALGFSLEITEGRLRVARNQE